MLRKVLIPKNIYRRPAVKAFVKAFERKMKEESEAENPVKGRRGEHEQVEDRVV